MQSFLTFDSDGQNPKVYLGFLSVTGVGALYIRRRPRVRVDPIQSGGGQERCVYTDHFFVFI